jgi:nucleotide-binding universal stress UspA family protein
MSRKGRVVVGVDGSECSLEALRWAFEEASRHGAELVAVTTWTLAPPPIVYPYAGFQPDLEGDAESLARSAVEDAVAPMLESGPDVPVEIVEVEGHPVQVLAQTSQDADLLSREADLLVVGSRGHGASPECCSDQ